MKKCWHTDEESRKYDILIAFGYATIISLGIACYLHVLGMHFDSGSPYTYPYAEPATKVLGITALVMLIGLVVCDFIRGRKMRFAILLRLGITAACVIPFSLVWLHVFNWLTLLVRFVRNVLH